MAFSNTGAACATGIPGLLEATSHELWAARERLDTNARHRLVGVQLVCRRGLRHTVHCGVAWHTGALVATELAGMCARPPQAGLVPLPRLLAGAVLPRPMLAVDDSQPRHMQCIQTRFNTLASRARVRILSIHVNIQITVSSNYTTSAM